LSALAPRETGADGALKINSRKIRLVAAIPVKSGPIGRDYIDAMRSVLSSPGVDDGAVVAPESAGSPIAT
jgi:hypothetical protein